MLVSWLLNRKLKKKKKKKGGDEWQICSLPEVRRDTVFVRFFFFFLMWHGVTLVRERIYKARY